MMIEFAQGIADSNLFETLVPLPPDGGDLEYWGTKWDVVDGEFRLETDKLSGSGFFMTAWTPPIGAYEKLAQLGFEIYATYYEPGMAFGGTWSNDNGHYYHEYDFEDKNWRDKVLDSGLLHILEDEYERWLEDDGDEEDEEQSVVGTEPNDK